jgi:hypothetical protein
MKFLKDHISRQLKPGGTALLYRESDKAAWVYLQVSKNAEDIFVVALPEAL